ncbi:UNVERIFIED_CONTAM: hypothetical protein GTU68_015287 [Idotea baltica]|nr:hypothetical protein [Idotea baltica]
MVTGLLDKRAAGIKTQLDEARKAREQAQKLLASFERKSEEMKREAGTIVERAKEDSKRAAEQAKLDLQESISRKLKAAEDRISQVEAAATREVRNAAASAAVTAATEVLGQKIDGSKGDALIDDGIALVASQLH